jgi:hypothetical protein
VMAEADKAPVSLGTSTSSAIVRAPPTPTRVPARVMCQGLNEGQVSEAAKRACSFAPSSESKPGSPSSISIRSIVPVKRNGGV